MGAQSAGDLSPISRVDMRELATAYLAACVPTTPAAAQSLVQRVSSGWRGAPPVEVVARPCALPFQAPDDARGAYEPQAAKVWIVASTQRTHEVLGTVAHEVFAHHGLRQSLGRTWCTFMSQVQRAARSGDPMIRNTRALVRGAYDPLHPFSESDEVAAAIVEQHINDDTGRYEPPRPLAKLAKAMAGDFARNHLHADVPVSADQLEGALLEAQHMVVHGGRLWGVAARVRNWYAAATMPKPLSRYEPPMSMGESERLLKEEDRHRDSMAVLGAIPGVLILIVCAWLFFSMLYGAFLH